MPAPLSAAELQIRLDYLLGPVLSSRRTAAPLAGALAALGREDQDFVLHWTEIIDRSNYELAYQFTAMAPAALQLLGRAAAETWIVDALDLYDREGLHRGSRAFREFGIFRKGAAAGNAVRFTECAPVLELFACGLAGRRLKLDTAEEAGSDTETLWLPAAIAMFADKSDNFAVYKILVALLWAQGRYGTWQADITATCSGRPDPARAARLLAHFESLRLEARISAAMPGIGRMLARLRPEPPDPRCARLLAADARVGDSLELLAALYWDFEPPQLPWQFVLHPGAGPVRAARLARERSALASALAELMRQHPPPENPAAAADRGRFSIQSSGATDSDGRIEYELRLDGRTLQPKPELAQLLESIHQDLGRIPDDYLAVETAGQARERDHTDGGHVDEATADGPAEQEILHYDEWDHQRRHYRRRWCALRETDLEPADNGFVEATLARYRPQIARLKQTFEALRGEDRTLKRQPAGDDIDFDALVEGCVELKTGKELPERLFARRRKNERNLAALFMVDMSGSTKGWINDAEREALVMLGEALEVLGDRYAIYGFSGITRQRCEIYRIKRFDEAYDDTVRRRIAGITPRDYTRMGAAIRHLTRRLNEVAARTKLLVTLSDGKPDDYSDHYRGEYGIEDTRQALIEAQRSGIHPFCITIDHEARDYLPHLYGPVNWTLVENVTHLPFRVSDIYRRLTR